MTTKSWKSFAGLLIVICSVVQSEAVETLSLRGHIPAAVKRLNLKPSGTLPSDTILHLHFGLPLRNQQDFNNTLTQLYNPASPRYHQWLTPEQIALNYGPSEQDYQSVIAMAESNHLHLAHTWADHSLVGFDAAAGDVEKMLHVKMVVYQHPSRHRTFYAPDREPSVDSRVPLLHITGLDNLVDSEMVSQAPSTYAGSGTNGGFWGNDFRAAYAAGVSLTGAGQRVGIYSSQLYFSNDIASYRASTGIPEVNITNVLVDTNFTPTLTNGSGGEISVDIEMANAMAPGLEQIIVYQGYDGLLIYKAMQSDNLAKQLSSSWELSGDTNYDMVFQMIASQGQSIFIAAGDNGAYSQGNGENFVDSPYVTIVGGTVLSTSSPGGAWAAETVWTNTGGGISITGANLDNYPIPSWQQNVSMSLNGGSTTHRNIPDVAMVATDIYNTWGNGLFRNQNSGTSFATPLWAGFTALVNEKATASGQSSVGFLNPLIYAIGTGPSFTNCFHDITVGSNPTSPKFTTNYPGNVYYAAKGYDLCTGWGSPIGKNLINALLQASAAVWVDFNYHGAPILGTYTNPYPTLSFGVTNVNSGGNIFLKAGSSAETITISKPLTMSAVEGPVTIGN